MDAVLRAFLLPQKDLRTLFAAQRKVPQVRAPTAHLPKAHSTAQLNVIGQHCATWLSITASRLARAGSRLLSVQTSSCLRK